MTKMTLHCDSWRGRFIVPCGGSKLWGSYGRQNSRGARL